MRALYTLSLFLLTPLVILRLFWRSRRLPAYRERIPERFGFGDPLPDNAIWVHAVSVGEVQVSSDLIRGLQRRHPDTPIVVTTTTPTGAERVKLLFGDSVIHRYMPYDLPFAVNRFVRGFYPAIAIIVETEIWPNLYAVCARSDIPLVVVNARLSERSARGYSHVRKLATQALGRVTAIGVNSEPDRSRLLALGASPQTTRVTGNLKFDIEAPASAREQGEALRRILGNDRPVWIAASTREGEEQLVLKAHAKIRAKHAGALLILVPRHPDRFDKVSALCEKSGMTVIRRSGGQRVDARTDIYLADTMGELPMLYAAADLAFIGGSLVETGGHNMLEAAVVGIPVLFGPNVFNFATIADKLQQAGGGLMVADPSVLETTVDELLGDSVRRSGLGAAAYDFVRQNRGALQASEHMIDAVIAGEYKAAASR